MFSVKTATVKIITRRSNDYAELITIDLTTHGNAI